MSQGYANGTATATYRPRLTKRRRTKADVAAIRAAIRATLVEDNPQTVRGVFYQLVTRGAIPKSDSEYKNTVVRLLGDMRRDGSIPFGWIADSTRWQRKPATFSSMEEALERTAKTYRRALWDDVDAYVEVWLEKEALAGVLFKATSPWDVPLMVTRGYPSLSYLYEAAETIKAVRKPTFLYYLGDRDPSGVDIPRTVERSLREMAPQAEIHFTKLAVTQEQIQFYKLPSRPTKKTDSRAKGFVGDSVEVDAIPGRELRRLVEEAVERHIDRRAVEKIKLVEQQERRTLQQVARDVGDDF